jgi:hypothetical protein
MSGLADALKLLVANKDASGKIQSAIATKIDSQVGNLNSSIEMLETIGISRQEVVRELRIQLAEQEVRIAAKSDMFNAVPLPLGLKHEHLAEAMDYTTGLIAAMNRDLREGVGRPLAGFIQANNFSGIVSNILTDAMHRFSPYKHNHDQRYPDLKDSDGNGLEMKAANKAGKGGESHNAHGGWHLIACFNLLDNGDIRFLQIEIAELVSYLDERDGDWHYCGSKVNEEGSQRTETYYTTNRGTWKLRDGSVYLDKELVDFSRWRRTDGTMPIHSPLVVERKTRAKKARAE